MIFFDASNNIISFSEYKPERLTILVQAYGRLDKTKKCVANLLKYAPSAPFDLILEDNGSESNDIINFYKTINYPRKYIVRIEKNHSAPHGLNKIIRFVDTKYLILINNDTYVMPNTLDNLIKCADSDERIGMVASVSTNVSHGQQEDLGGFFDEDEMIAKAKKFNVSNNLLWEERMLLIPLTTLYRSKVFSKIGLYDEDFQHDFGDVDISFRIRRAGFKLMLCRDSFVHHDHLQIERENDYFYKLANDGRKLFNEKYHGIDEINDTRSISKILKQLHREETKTKKKILVIEPCCGTSVLDIRNYYRKQGITDVESYTFSTKAKYYQDLISVADNVVVDRIDFLSEYFEPKTFDMVVLCKNIDDKEQYKQIEVQLKSYVNDTGIFISG